MNTYTLQTAALCRNAVGQVQARAQKPRDEGMEFGQRRNLPGSDLLNSALAASHRNMPTSGSSGHAKMGVLPADARPARARCSVSLRPPGCHRTKQLR